MKKWNLMSNRPQRVNFSLSTFTHWISFAQFNISSTIWQAAKNQIIHLNYFCYRRIELRGFNIKLVIRPLVIAVTHSPRTVIEFISNGMQGVSLLLLPYKVGPFIIFNFGWRLRPNFWTGRRRVTTPSNCELRVLRYPW